MNKPSKPIIGIPPDQINPQGNPPPVESSQTTPASEPPPIEEAPPPPEEESTTGQGQLDLPAALTIVQDLTSKESASTLDLTYGEISERVAEAGHFKDTFSISEILALPHSPLILLIYARRDGPGTIVVSQMGAALIGEPWASYVTRLSKSTALPSRLMTERISSIWL
jgi:hypothetical protein